MVLSTFQVLALCLCFEAVKPQTDYVPPDHIEVSSTPMGDIAARHKCGEGPNKGLNECVPYHRCHPVTNTTIPEGQEREDSEANFLYQINIRLGEPRPCRKIMEVCCKTAEDSGPQPPTPRPTPVIPVKSQCGIRNKNGISFQVQGNTHNEAEFGEFPWMVAIIKKNFAPAPSEAFSLCGGSLIAPRVVLTAAHYVHELQASELKARAGEWDAKTTDEEYPFQERNVAKIILHERFRFKGLLNDIALLILETPFNKARHIGTACLPSQNEVIFGKECFATGWGKNVFGDEGQYQLILKKIGLPTVPHEQCQRVLRSGKLGNSFSLHESFMCAGGEEGKDTCTGDGGSPLVCPDPKNPSRYVQVGIVAWGLGCQTKFPGVYTHVAKFRSWVDGHMQKLNLPIIPYVS